MDYAATRLYLVKYDNVFIIDKFIVGLPEVSKAANRLKPDIRNDMPDITNSGSFKLAQSTLCK